MGCSPQALVHPLRTKVLARLEWRGRLPRMTYNPCWENPRLAQTGGQSESIRAPESEGETPGKPMFCTTFPVTLFDFDLSYH